MTVVAWSRAARCAALALVLASRVAAADIRVVSDHSLPEAAAKALDIRWVSNDSVLVTTFSGGVLKVQTGDPRRVAPYAFMPANAGGCWSCSRIGLSEQYIATAFDVGQIQWKSASSPQIHP